MAGVWVPVWQRSVGTFTAKTQMVPKFHQGCVKVSGGIQSSNYKCTFFYNLWFTEMDQETYITVARTECNLLYLSIASGPAQSKTAPRMHASFTGTQGHGHSAQPPAVDMVSSPVRWPADTVEWARRPENTTACGDLGHPTGSVAICCLVAEVRFFEIWHIHPRIFDSSLE